MNGVCIQIMMRRYLLNDCYRADRFDEHQLLIQIAFKRTEEKQMYLQKEKIPKCDDC